MYNRSVLYVLCELIVHVRTKQVLVPPRDRSTGNNASRANVTNGYQSLVKTSRTWQQRHRFIYGGVREVNHMEKKL